METTRSAALLRMARSIFASRAEGAEAEEGAEGGFTLIELMVVLLIMAILLAIAIPTFLGVKGGAQNRAVQSDLTNAVTSAKAYYTNLGSYGTVATTVSTALQKQEPELTFTTGSAVSGTAHNVSLAVSGDGYILILAGQSGNQTCWYVEDNEESSQTSDAMTGATTTQGISYASSAGVTSTTGCSAGSPGTNWQSSYPQS